MSAQLMKFLKVVQGMLIHHQHTIEIMKETLGDSSIVALSAATKCDHPGCTYPATVKWNDCPSHLCDRHLAERVVSGQSKEDEWEDLHYADCVRNMHDYIVLRDIYTGNCTLH